MKALWSCGLGRFRGRKQSMAKSVERAWIERAEGYGREQALSTHTWFWSGGGSSPRLMEFHTHHAGRGKAVGNEVAVAVAEALLFLLRRVLSTFVTNCFLASRVCCRSTLSDHAQRQH